MKKYELTEEHRSQFKMWAAKWIENTMSTKPMTEEEKEICRKAVKGMYEAANLKPPPDERIVFVSSPFILKFASGFAAAIWHMRKNPQFKLKAATEDTTSAATRAATSAATRAATWDATRDATGDATSDKKDKWFSFPISAMQKLSAALGLAEFGLACANNAYNMWNGGNQWSSWVGFLTFFRYVANLAIDYSKFEHYEKLAMHSGPRIMHPEFCMISDRPEFLETDDKDRPHCDTGPFCRWRDGSALYAIHGVRVPQYIVETSGNELDVKRVLAEQNIDVRREGLRKIPLERILKETDAKLIDSWKDERPWCWYELYDMDFKDGKVRRVLRMKNPSLPDTYHMERVEDDCETVKQAISWRNGQDDYLKPKKEFYEREVLT